MNTAIALIDGTCFDETTGGNVHRIDAMLLHPRDKHQRPNYEPGPGTYQDEKLGGSIYGAHLDDIIVCQYQMLGNMCLSKPAPDGWQIAMFGFSRGAFACRVLAALVDRCGMPNDPCRKENQELVRELMRHPESLKTFKMDTSNFHPVPISYMGLFDTVNATFAFDSESFLSCPPCVRSVRHAVSLNESRQAFRNVPFAADPRVDEEWFMGEHCDVGGGETDGNHVLSRIALAWITAGARNAGVEFRKLANFSEEFDPIMVAPHDSSGDLSGIGASVHRAFPKDGRLHPSVNKMPISPFDGLGVPLFAKDLTFAYKRRVAGGAVSVILPS